MITRSYRKWKWGQVILERQWIKGSFVSFWNARGLYIYENDQGFESFLRVYDPEIWLECMQRWVDILYDEKTNLAKIFQDLLLNYHEEFPKLGINIYNFLEEIQLFSSSTCFGSGQGNLSINVLLIPLSFFLIFKATGRKAITFT
ncbi:MAG: hypothetical protein KKA81_10705 [Bacteroidetes bacterium]|nr:hypothetical protein [Bacteroidota bacterium]